MRIASIFGEAWQALRFNRQRSLLTMLSLGWGVSCFVILYSYGEGFERALTKAFQQVGEDLVLVFGGQTSSQAGGERAGRKIRLELTDVEALRESVPSMLAISPEALFRNANVVAGYRTQSVTLRGIRPAYGRVRNMTLADGRWINDEDEQHKLRVAVIGAKMAEKLFGEMPAVGQQLRVNGMSFEIVGLLETKTQISNYNTPDNECLFIPFSAMSLLRDIKYPDNLVMMPVNPMFRAEMTRHVRETLGRIHGFPPGDERAIEVIVFNEFMRMITVMALALRGLLGFIGALTLAIGGVGLANIMLVSVTQRTREIGVLKSLGATKRAVLLQFLLEALAIVTAGGILGVAAGWAATAGIGSLPFLGALFEDTSGRGDIHLQLSTFAVVTSTVMLEIVGLAAGLLPAIKASRLDPIEALRYE